MSLSKISILYFSSKAATKSTKSTSSGGSGAVSTTSIRMSPVKDGPVNKRGYAEVEIGSDTEKKKKKKAIHDGFIIGGPSMTGTEQYLGSYIEHYGRHGF